MIGYRLQQSASRVGGCGCPEHGPNRGDASNLATAQLDDSAGCDAAQRVDGNVARLACDAQCFDSRGGARRAFGDRIIDRSEYDKIGAGSIRRFHLSNRMRRDSDEFRLTEQSARVTDRE